MTDLDDESGGHRFQRVPPTEHNGRVHTSTVTVALLDQADIARKQRALDEFRLEWFSGTGKGGQYRNKHQNCFQLLHPPTGMIQTATSREREADLKFALAEINRRLNELESEQMAQTRNGTRKLQAGSGMRGDKRRTYRFREDSVREDITGKVAQASKVMRGRFDLLW